MNIRSTDQKHCHPNLCRMQGACLTDRVLLRQGSIALHSLVQVASIVYYRKKRFFSCAVGGRLSPLPTDSRRSQGCWVRRVMDMRARLCSRQSGITGMPLVDAWPLGDDGMHCRPMAKHCPRRQEPRHHQATKTLPESDKQHVVVDCDNGAAKALGEFQIS